MTAEEILNSLPPKKRKGASKETIQKILDIANDEDIAEEYKQNFLTHINVVSEGKYSLEDYKNAILFVTHKLLGTSDIDAYALTFPERYKRQVDRGLERSRISSYASAYKGTSLVAKLLEQSLVPSWILNAPLYQEAINFQASLLHNEEASFAVRQKAADSIMTHIKPPESQKIEIDIGVKKDSVVDEYEENIRRLVQKQQELIAQGADVKMVANAGIISKEEEYEDAEIE